MKFGALLRSSAGESNGLQELYTSYKQLKKQLKRLPERQALAGGVAAITAEDAQALGANEANFVAVMSADVARFNDMFLEREEDAVIRLRSLEDDAAACTSAADLQDVYRRFVDFHGEMLLLVHWSILAYTGLVKILKKHHKRTGLLVRAPHLDNLASQPFCSTELMNELVRKAEADIDVLRTRLAASGSGPRPDVSAASAYVSQSARLLQAARDGEGPELAASDSGSAPSLDDDDEVATSETSDAEAAAAAACNGAATAVSSGAAADGVAAAAAGASAGSMPAGSADATLRHNSRKRPAEAAVAGQQAGDGAEAALPAPTRRKLDPGVLPARGPVAPAAGATVRRVPDVAAAAAASGSATAAPSSGSSRASPAAVLQGSAAAGSQPGSAGAARASGSAAAAASGSASGGSSGAAAAAGAASPQPRQQQQQGQRANGVRSPPRILAQTQAALGLWKELTETASTPSTVLPMGHRALRPAYAASSVTTDQSAA